MKDIRNITLGNKKTKVYTIKAEVSDLCISFSDYASLIYIDNKIYQVLSLNIQDTIFATVEFIELQDNIKSIYKLISKSYDEVKRQKKWLDCFMDK